MHITSWLLAVGELLHITVTKYGSAAYCKRLIPLILMQVKRESNKATRGVQQKMQKKIGKR